MNIRSAGISVARFVAPLFRSHAAQTGAENVVRFFEALQGIGTGARFSSRELSNAFASIPASQSVIFDVGAHAGLFLEEALKRTSPDSLIHAFEPASASFRQLSKAFGEQGRVRLNRAALSRISGSGVLFYDEAEPELASLTARARFRLAKSEGVRLTTLDEYCSINEITQIDLLKLDVEGHELEVLQGAGYLLARDAIRRILFEFGGCNIDTRVFFRDLYELLTSTGMRVYRVMPSGKLLPITKYDESLERFRTTNYLATF
jgi:FkbM family methyltransferase